MRSIEPPGQFATAAEVLASQAAFDKRRPYNFTPLTKRDTGGYQRLKGPALAGLARCVNTPKSMRLPHTRPTTTCNSGSPCACGKTVTVTPDQSPRERMPAAWGTTDWAAAYHRRSAIESTNAEAKTHRLDIGRGFTRVFGTVRNTLLSAFAFAGMNVRMIRDWHAKRRLADPWAVYLSEPDLGDDGGSIKKTRTRRRTATLNDLLDHPPPGSDVRSETEDLT